MRAGWRCRRDENRSGCSLDNRKLEYADESSHRSMATTEAMILNVAKAEFGLRRLEFGSERR